MNRSPSAACCGVVFLLLASPSLAPAEPTAKGKVTGRRWLPEYEADNRAYLTVAIGCTGGHHRSVYLAERLAERLSGRAKGAIVRHREL